MSQADGFAALVEYVAESLLVLAERNGQRHNQRYHPTVRFGERQGGFAEKVVQVAEAAGCSAVAFGIGQPSASCRSHRVGQGLVGRVADNDVEAAVKVLMKQQAGVGFGWGVGKQRGFGELAQFWAG